MSEVSCCYIQVCSEPGWHHISQHAPLIQSLRAHWSKLCHIPYSGPRQRRLRCLKAAIPSWWPGIRYSQVLDDRPQKVRGQRGQDATNAALRRGNNRHCLLSRQRGRLERKGEAKGKEEGWKSKWGGEGGGRDSSAGPQLRHDGLIRQKTRGMGGE